MNLNPRLGEGYLGLAKVYLSKDQRTLALEIIRKVTIMLYPIMPSTSLKVLKIFSISENEIEFKSIIDNSFLKANTKIAKLDILFKKIEKND